MRRGHKQRDDEEQRRHRLASFPVPCHSHSVGLFPFLVLTGVIALMNKRGTDHIAECTLSPDAAINLFELIRKGRNNYYTKNIIFRLSF